MAGDIMIDMARICIPYPTGYTKNDQTYGIKVFGYDTTRYELFKNFVNWIDDGTKFKDFYDVVSAVYQVDLSYVPDVRPYVSWVDWCKKNGGVLMHGGDAQQKKILKEANTLICDSVADRDFLQHMFLNLSRRMSGDFQFNYEKPVPPRFANVKDARIVGLVNKLAFPNEQRVK